MNANMTKGNEFKKPIVEKLKVVTEAVKAGPRSGVISLLNKQIMITEQTTTITLMKANKEPYRRADNFLGMDRGRTTPKEKVTDQNILPVGVSPIKAGSWRTIIELRVSGSKSLITTI